MAAHIRDISNKHVLSAGQEGFMFEFAGVQFKSKVLGLQGMAVGGCVLLCLLWPCPFPRPRAARFDCVVRMWPLPPFPSPCLARNHSLSRLHTMRRVRRSPCY
jgi:hypothetical protein